MGISEISLFTELLLRIHDTVVYYPSEVDESFQPFLNINVLHVNSNLTFSLNQRITVPHHPSP